jgi:ribosomal protein S18 acetylase RimI-like enzyme
MIESLERTALREAAGVLARAFQHNPGVCALLHDVPIAQRLALIEPAMRGFTRAAARAGAASVIQQQGKIVAVSLAFPPRAYPPALATELVMLSGVLRAGLRRALRFQALDAWIRTRHVREPHWYVWLLGVEPEMQGRRLGSELLRAISQRAERDAVPCYLETDKPSSVRLYERHGYVVQLQEDVPKLAFRLWYMLRRV